MSDASLTSPPPAPDPAADAALPRVAVRALCEFTDRHGDLDLRFTPSATALEGIAGQAIVAARRGSDYETEIALAADCAGLHVRGRADGFDPQALRLEEVKTIRRVTGAVEAVTANRRALHRAQARSYGALLARSRGLPALEVAVVYFDVASQDETIEAEPATAAELQAELDARCRAYGAWAAQEAAHRQVRDAALGALAFAHPSFRDGQRRLAEAVWRAARAGRHLLAQAPTGIGKTLGTIYPMLRAMPAGGLDKLFVLTAKTPGRALALHALAAIAGANPALPLRVLELVARDKACEHPDKACHGESCPLARGFFDRLPAARAEAVARRRMDRVALRETALAHRICPYWLGHEMIRWADVVVGDYHHWFDAQGVLHGLAEAEGWRVALLVDEAHNLVERARAMYSAALDTGTLRAVATDGAVPLPVARALRRLARECEAVVAGSEPPYQALPALPEPWREALQAAVAAIADHQAAQPLPAGGDDGGLLDLFFTLLRLARLAEDFGAHSLFDVTSDVTSDAPRDVGVDAAGDATSGRSAAPATPDLFGTPARAVIAIRNVVPAPFLRPRFERAATATLFSATLAPDDFERTLLGLPADTAWIDVPAPFDPRQLAVRLVRDVSTRWRDRAASVAPIASLIVRQFERAPGNYLAFFSSYDYLEQVRAEVQARAPALPVWAQTRSMDEAARAGFVARFRGDGCGIGFAVLGGAFGEGIDLPGRRLVGAFVVTLGLPQVNPVSMAMRERLRALFGDDEGDAFATTVPALRKVVQAAGRVIRGPDDRGCVFLIDDRFARADVRRLLPAWWAAEVTTAARAPTALPAD